MLPPVVNLKFNMAQTVTELYDSQNDFCDSIEIFACGSNLFGQIESINEAECNIKVSVPIQIDDRLKTTKQYKGNTNFEQKFVC